MNELENYRNQIDEIDLNILYLLKQRFEVVNKVGEYKKQNNLQPLQKDRWNNLLNNLKNEAKLLSINPNLIENIWNLIHEEALNIEK